MTPTWTSDCGRVELYHADCLDVLPTLADGSIDAVVTDPPYACVQRNYGYWTEPEWHEYIDGVMAEVQRIVTPEGSAMVLIQPNSERIGKLRTWVWDFASRWAKRWGVVQDAYWINDSALPNAGANRKHGLMRGATKYCLWFGSPKCWRDQDAILWQESERNRLDRLGGRMRNMREIHPSGNSVNRANIASAAGERGGVTPFNFLPIANTSNSNKHGAATPQKLMEWWVRYICPPGGVVLDPHSGWGTCGLAAIRQGRRYIGIERDAEHYAKSVEQISDELKQGRLPLEASA